MNIRWQTLGAALAVALLAVSATAQSARGYLRVMQGPMLGAVGPDHAHLWVRLSDEVSVQIAYSTSPEMDEPLWLSSPVTAQNAHDRCVSVRLEDLAPSTTYYYQVRVEGKVDRYLEGKLPWSFRTAPASGQGARFRVAYGSCARWQLDAEQAIWPAVREWSPDLFFWLGDNIYGDSLQLDTLREEYRRQREVRSFRALGAEVAQLAIWDDHDFGLNNHDRTSPTRESGLQVHKEYWANPAYGEPGNPGVYFAYNYGGVDFFFLDGRTYRDPNDQEPGPDKTMLGTRQLAWLKEGLKASSAPFKVLVSGSVWTSAKGSNGDAWSAFLDERNALFAWIRDEAVTGVVLFSGDTHTGELNVIPFSADGGYDFYDLTASPLAQEAEDNWVFRPAEKRVRLPYSMGANFGLVEFDLRDPADAQLTFYLVGVEGKPVWRPFVLKASELVNGRQSWPDKIAPDAARWNEQFANGWSD